MSRSSAGFSGTHFVFSLVLLAGITAAIYRLTRELPEGFAIAFFLSPMIPLGWIFTIWFINRLSLMTNTDGGPEFRWETTLFLAFCSVGRTTIKK